MVIVSDAIHSLTMIQTRGRNVYTAIYMMKYQKFRNIYKYGCFIYIMMIYVIDEVNNKMENTSRPLTRTELIERLTALECVNTDVLNAWTDAELHECYTIQSILLDFDIQHGAVDVLARFR